MLPTLAIRSASEGVMFEPRRRGDAEENADGKASWGIFYAWHA